MSYYQKPGNKHWVPAVRLKEDFPFKNEIVAVPDEAAEEWLKNNKPDATMDFILSGNFSEDIRNQVISMFPFHKYPNEKNKIPEDLKYFIEVKIYRYKKTGKKNAKKRVFLKTGLVIVNNFSSTYSFNLIESLEELKDLLDKNEGKRMSFDLETTGLNPLDDKIVGVAMAFEPKIGYYVAIDHDEEFEKYNIHKEGLDLIYEALLKAKIVDTYNSRFDLRFMEFTDPKYIMKDVNILDAQITTWFSDPGNKTIRTLKKAEQHFLGYKRPNLEDTLKGSDLKSFNVGLIDPRKLILYGATDGISTLELGMVTEKYHKEFGLSGEIDRALLYRLLKMENHGIRINTDYLKEQLEYIVPELERIDSELKDSIGDVNLNSPLQKRELFKSFGIDTGVKTKTGQMSTGNIDKLIERMEAKGEDIPNWLRLIDKRSKLDKLNSTFFKSLLKQAEERGGRVRLNYRNAQTATGRFSSGQEL